MSKSTAFKIGDRVRSVWLHDESYGHTGTIVDTLDGSYVVDFDEFKGWGRHSRNGRTGNNCWFVAGEVLTLIGRPSAGSQEDVILRHLISGETITRIQADHLYRVASLTKVIHRLRKAGHKIVAQWKVDPTGRPYKSYSLRAQKKVA